MHAIRPNNHTNGTVAHRNTHEMTKLQRTSLGVSTGLVGEEPSGGASRPRVGLVGEDVRVVGRGVARFGRGRARTLLHAVTPAQVPGVRDALALHRRCRPLRHAVANQCIGLSAAVGVQTTGNNLHPENLTLFAVVSFPVSKCVIFVQINENFAFGVTVSGYDMAG